MSDRCESRIATGTERTRATPAIRVRIGPVERSGTVVDLRDVSWDPIDGTGPAIVADDSSIASADPASSAATPASNSNDPRVERVLDRIRPAATAGRPRRRSRAQTGEPTVGSVSRDSGTVPKAEDETTCVTIACVRPSTSTAFDRVPARRSLRGLLAIVARERGHVASVGATIAARRRRLEEIDLPAVDLADARRKVASVGADIHDLRERAATIRGELTARRELEEDREAVRADLEATLTELSEAETARIAAKQDLDRARRAARHDRDRRERRLRLEDEIANLEREARRELAAAVHPAFRSTLEGLPIAVEAGSRPGEWCGPRTIAEIAAISLAGRRAPIVVVGNPAVGTESDGAGGDEGDDIATAALALGVPIVRL